MSTETITWNKCIGTGYLLCKHEIVDCLLQSSQFMIEQSYKIILNIHCKNKSRFLLFAMFICLLISVNLKVI